jgi:hypothetical protein
MVLLTDHLSVKATFVKGFVVWLMRYKKPGLCRILLPRVLMLRMTEILSRSIRLTGLGVGDTSGH